MKGLQKVFKEAISPYHLSEHYHRIQELKLFDDNFMTIVFEDPACLKLLVEAIIDVEDVEIVEHSTQKHVINLDGHSVIYYIYVK